MNSGQSQTTDGFINEKAAAELLGISTGMLARARRAGIAPQFIQYPSGAVRYRSADVMDYLTKHTFNQGVNKYEKN